MKKLSREELKLAAAMTRAGESAGTAAQKLGVRRDTLYRALKREGIEWKRDAGRASRKYTPGRARELERLMAAGMTLKSACAQVGITPCAANRWQRQRLIDLSGRKYGKHPGEEKYRAIYRRYIEDKSATPAELGRIYGIKYKALLRAWNRMGLKLDKERVREARIRGGQSSRCEINGRQLKRAWERYTGAGYISCAQMRKEMGISWERIKREWARMGYDVDAAVRRKYDREHGAGTYDAMMGKRTKGEKLKGER